MGVEHPKMPQNSAQIAIFRPGTAPEPPAELGVTGSELWRGILSEWDMQHRASLEVLAQACLTADRAESLRRQILVSGEVIELDGGSIKANPLIMVELTARALVARLLGKLDLLDIKPKRGPGRPPKRSGW